jgi:hypothetical protein
MIAYKIIGSRNRMGTNYNIFINEHRLFPSKVVGRLMYPKLWTKLKKYYPRYEFGFIVEAVSGSAGIFCFCSIEDARLFISEYFDYYGKRAMRIIQVEGYNQSKGELKNLRPVCGSYPENLLLDNGVEYELCFPRPIITFEAVKVLE